MIVDDNDSVRKAIRHTLNDYADKIIECSDGTEAVQLYPMVHPDWVLMDIVMKTMDGFAATSEIKKKDANARVIIVTQYNDIGYKEKAKSVGAVGFVNKELLEEMHTIMQSEKEPR